MDGIVPSNSVPGCCDVALPASAASSNGTLGHEGGALRQQMVHRSASHRHVVVLMSEPEHGHTRKGQMREDAGVQPHR